MSIPTQSGKPLNVPRAQAAHFSRNFIKLAVCEFRFPTLFELEADQPPLGFSKAIRKEYPSHELLKNVKINPGSLAQAHAHSFRSRKGRWTVTLRAGALSLETSNYDSFAEFAERVGFLLAAAKETVDSDFFTRVGLRYINALPFSPAEITGWVNPLLVSALGDGTFGDIEEYWQRVRGPTSVGGYLFQHGVSTEPRSPREYILDLDFYREDVAIAEAEHVVRQLHELEFATFAWCLGERAKEHLGPSDLKS